MEDTGAEGSTAGTEELGTNSDALTYFCGYMVNGEIEAKYRSLGGTSSFLGCPTTHESRTQCGGGYYNNFQGGAITWGPYAGAHETHGPIRVKWAEQGYECGSLGFPTTDELPGSCAGLRYNNFENGAIVWTPQYGAFKSQGIIRAAWAYTGYECGPLGPPSSDEGYSATSDWGGPTYYQYYANGYIVTVLNGGVWRNYCYVNNRGYITC